MVTEVRELKFKLLTVVAFTKFVKKLNFTLNTGAIQMTIYEVAHEEQPFKSLLGLQIGLR